MRTPCSSSGFLDLLQLLFSSGFFLWGYYFVAGLSFSFFLFWLPICLGCWFTLLSLLGWCASCYRHGYHLLMFNFCTDAEHCGYVVDRGVLLFFLVSGVRTIGDSLVIVCCCWCSCSLLFVDVGVVGLLLFLLLA